MKDAYSLLFLTEQEKKQKNSLRNLTHAMNPVRSCPLMALFAPSKVPSKFLTPSVSPPFRGRKNSLSSPKFRLPDCVAGRHPRTFIHSLQYKKWGLLLVIQNYSPNLRCNDQFCILLLFILDSSVFP